MTDTKQDYSNADFWYVPAHSMSRESSLAHRILLLLALLAHRILLLLALLPVLLLLRRSLRMPSPHSPGHALLHECSRTCDNSARWAVRSTYRASTPVPCILLCLSFVVHQRSSTRHRLRVLHDHDAIVLQHEPAPVHTSANNRSVVSTLEHSMHTQAQVLLLRS